MIHTVIRHSQRFAGLMLLAALAVTATPAQQQNKKAVLARQPAANIRIQPREIARKPAERVLETGKSPVRQATGQHNEQKETLVKKPSGVSPKVITDQQGGPKTIAVGEPNGRIKRTVEGQKDVPKTIAVGEPNGVSRKKAEAGDAVPAGGGRGRLPGDGKQEATTGGPVRGGGLDGPARVKDTTGSPQADGTATPDGKQTTDLRKQKNDLRKRIKLESKDGGKSKEEASDLLIRKRGKAKADKTEAQTPPVEMPRLRARQRL